MASCARLPLPSLPLPLLLLACCALVATAAAANGNPYSCPPPVGPDVCVYKCYSDADCYYSDHKCCGTLCGGSMCIKAVTAARPLLQPSVGECPAVGSTSWVCRSRCTNDGDCRRGQRCCKHRCGGFSCLSAVLPAPPAIADYSR